MVGMLHFTPTPNIARKQNADTELKGFTGKKKMIQLPLSAFTYMQGNQIPRLHKMHMEAVSRLEFSRSCLKVAILLPPDGFR